MPQVKLTDRFVAHAKPEGGLRTDYFDEVTKGLALRVSEHGKKTWTYHFTSPRDAKRGRLTIGTYPATSLGLARTKALEAKTHVEAGLDPRTVQTSGTMTVGDLVEAYIAKHVAGLRSGPEVARRLRKNIIPIVGNVPLADLHRRDATRVVDTIAGRGAPTEATRAFEDLRAMLRWAVARGDLDHNPIDGMKKPPASKPRERVLTDDEIRRLWTSLPTALAKSLRCQQIIRLCLLTAQRVGEVAGMRRAELDLKQRLWSLPGSRTKNGHAHSVPLSSAALEIIGKPEELVFGDLDPMVVAKTIGRAQDRFSLAHWTAHDLRRTALTGMAKLGVAPLVLGHIANHRTTTKAGMTLSVYVNHAYEKEKREALELWADRLRGIVAGADVVPMRAKS
jgi:integrase